MLSFNKPVLMVSSYFPPTPGGSATIIKNLTDAFNNESIVLAVEKPSEGIPSDNMTRHPIYNLMSSVHFPGRVDGIWRHLQLPIAVGRLKRIARRHGCGVIVGVYPNAHAIDAACRAADELKLPFVAYLHDTIEEGMADTHLRNYAKTVQAKVFKKAVLLFVMSQGMADLYKKKYKRPSIPLVHTYPEKILKSDEEKVADSAENSLNAFWSGTIYRINHHALLRVYDALCRVGNINLNIATLQSRENLFSLGFSGNNIERCYFSANERERYLKFLRRQTFHILALDWPDESSVHPDELGTIFPTKTPEYLASGRPIIVHCPSDYFLARFFNENKCGLVVDSKNSNDLIDAVNCMIRNHLSFSHFSDNAINTAQMFNIENVAHTFVAGISTVLGSTV